MQMSLGKPESDDMIDFLKELRIALMETCVSLVHGYHQGNVINSFIPHIPRILEYMQKATLECQLDSELTKITIGLLGDITSIYINQQNKIIITSGNWVTELVANAQNYAKSESDNS